MMKLLGSLVLAAMAIALTPKSALAEQGVPIDAFFTVAFTRTPGQLTKQTKPFQPFAALSEFSALSSELSL